MAGKAARLRLHSLGTIAFPTKSFDIKDLAIGEIGQRR
jgi:hypothetical protein